MEEAKREKRERKSREYAESVEAKIFRQSEIDRLRAELDVLRKDRRYSAGVRDTKSYPIRMSIELRDEFAEIATEQNISQSELLEHFVNLTYAEPDERAGMWSKLFFSEEKVLANDRLSIEQLELLLEEKKKALSDKQERKAKRKAELDNF